MPDGAPETQWTMNFALAFIGIHHPEHRARARALAIGEALGVYRDYPTTPGCTAPFAPTWINEMVRRGSAAGSALAGLHHPRGHRAGRANPAGEPGLAVPVHPRAGEK